MATRTLATKQWPVLETQWPVLDNPFRFKLDGNLLVNLLVSSELDGNLF